MRTGSCNMDLPLCRFLKVLLLEYREGSIHKIHHKQGRMSSWMRAHALQMNREWQKSVQTETVSGERSVPIMNMKSLTSSFPLRPAKISCLLTLMIPPHSFLSLSWILGEEAEMEMSWLPAIGGNPLPYRQQKRVKKNERQTKQKGETCVCV